MDTLMSVQVKEGQVRTSPSFLAAIKGKLAYGERVSVLKDDGGWLEILDSNSGVSGWMHSSALTTKKIILTAGKEDVATSATSDEYALAGKGFNQQVENQYRKDNSNLDFSWVDKMGSYRVSSKQMEQFLAAGKVISSGGAG